MNIQDKLKDRDNIIKNNTPSNVKYFDIQEYLNFTLFSTYIFTYIMSTLFNSNIRKYLMKISARNQLKGTVKSIETGSVNAIVHIDIGNGNVISSTISIDAVKELGLAVGKEAYAIIKATSVMVGVE